MRHPPTTGPVIAWTRSWRPAATSSGPSTVTGTTVGSLDELLASMYEREPVGCAGWNEMGRLGSAVHAPTSEVG